MKRLLWSAAVYLVTFVAFLRSGECGLVNLDDYDYLPKARQVERFGVADVSQAIWMPLTWISYRFDLWAARDSGKTTTADSKTVRFMHLHSVALHSLNAVLLFWLLCAALGAQGLVAAIAALVWALHPLRVESVTWIASRKDVLSMAWLLIALLLWTVWRKRGGCAMYWAAIAGFAIGAAAKPSVMCFPALAMILDAVFLRAWRGCKPSEGWIAANWRTFLPYVPPVALSCAIAVFAAYAQHAGGAMSSTAGVPLWWKLVNAATAVGMYIKNTIWPLDLCCQSYMRHPAMPRGWWFGVALCAAAAWWMAKAGRRTWEGLREGRCEAAGCEEAAFGGALWFAVAIAPMLGIVGFGGHAFADRFTYIPAVGLSLALVAVAEMRKRRKVEIGAGIAVVAALAAVTWRQIGFWKGDETLWTHTLEVDGESNFMAHSVLGTYYFEFAHDLEKCIAHYDRALELDSEWSERTGVMYLLALAETGQRDRLQDAFLRYNTWFRGKFGMKDSVNQSIAEAVYQFGREDPSQPPGDGYERARQIVEESSGYAAMVPETGYLRYLLAKRAGDGKRAEKIAQELVADRKTTFGDAYLRFRFLERDFGRKKGEM